jgi:hypothetical protein
VHNKLSQIAILILFCVLVCFFPCLSQKMELVLSKPITGINLTSIDSQGNIFISKNDGEIIKANQRGELLLNYSPSKTGRVKQIDVWSPFKIATYYDSFQEMVVLNRFLSETVRYDFDDFNLGFISNASLNFQQNLWVIDESDFSLKLLDMMNGDVLVNQPFFQFLDVDDHDITFIKEYQNQLYVVDFEFGILIFDNLGNSINKLEIKGIQSLGFEKDTYYYLNNDSLFVQGIYSSDELIINLPRSNYQDVKKFGNYFYCSSPNQLDIYRYLREE